MRPAGLGSSGIPYRQLVLPVYIPSLLLAVSQGALMPILPLYARAFGVSYGMIGLLLSGQALGTLVADVPAGILIRRLGARVAMVVGMGVTVLSIVALFWARSVPEAVIYRFAGGVGGALFNVSRHAYLAGIVHVDRRGRAISFQGGVFRMGRLLGPAAGGAMAAAFGFRWPFLVIGAICAAAGILAAIYAQEPAPTPEGSRAQAGGWRASALLDAVRTRRRALAPAGLGFLFAQMIRAGRTVVVPLYAADVLGMDVQAIGLIESASRAVDLAMFIPAGYLMDHKGRKWAIVPSFIIQTAGIALIPITQNPSQLIAAACLYGIGNGLGSGSMMTLGADLSPPSARGEFLGFWRLIGDAGMSGAPLVVGTVADALVLPAAIWVISGAGVLASLVFALLVPETHRRPTPAGEPTSQ